MATRAESATAPARTVRPRAGWRIVARKELADHLLSVRFLILLGIVGLSAIGILYAASGTIRDVAADASGIPGLFLALFTLEPEGLPVAISFLTVVGLLTPLLGIAFGFDAVSGERSEGTLPRLVSQPIHRDDVINGKFAAGLTVIGLLLLTLTLTVAGLGMLRLGIVPQADEIARLVAWLLITFVYASFWLGLATLCSVLYRAATSALVCIAAWLVLALFWGLFAGLVATAIAPVPDEPTAQELVNGIRAEERIGRLSPTGLYDESTLVLLVPTRRTTSSIVLPEEADVAADLTAPLTLEQSLLVVWPQIVALVGLTVVCFAYAYVRFMRQEIRA